MRIPERWTALHAGDRIHTTIPWHRIEAYASVLSEQGYRFIAEETTRGYWIICLESPMTVSPMQTRH